METKLKSLTSEDAQVICGGVHVKEYFWGEDGRLRIAWYWRDDEAK